MQVLNLTELGFNDAIVFAMYKPVADGNKKEIEQLARAKFGKLEGIAQQYLFYWKRENT